ncbi:AAA family ATPase [Rhizobium leguminosarum]|uniref:TniB family NTP-binding protein n=1 Tax=Rhizobium leguminosarum TaxID=384 RepID=UPI001C9551AF|nr:TniB family NTP-binding protein [Rhizobium leguminosarum]MBY5667371.1 AAA family ATPase [Rhizobium leguminosarum]MBY5710123.1 AAA family ATPase [Rhizobium leguminosarum]MBY5721575.1 AAA family ATPase [Rhizobium leguminosarum]
MLESYAKLKFEASANAIYARMPPEMQRRAKVLGELNSYYEETEFDAQFEVYFEEMMVNVTAQLFGHSGKQRVIFVVGDSNSGKTSLVEHHLLLRPELQSFVDPDGEERSPVLRFDGPSKLTGKSIALAGLKALDYEIKSKTMSEQDLYALFVDQMIENGKIIAHIDEMQQVVREGNDEKIASVADVIKLMAQVKDFPIHLIFSGLPTVANFLSARPDAPNRDQQLSNRTHSVVHLPKLSATEETDTEMVKKAMGKISNLTGIRLGDVMDEETIGRIMHAASYAFGSIVELIKKAFGNALTYGDKIVEKDNFVAAYRQWRGCLPEQNIMSANDWKLIKPQNSVSHVLPALVEKPTDEAIDASGAPAQSENKRARKKGQ